jgi:mono/diheme cytochrome c family protein
MLRSKSKRDVVSGRLCDGVKEPRALPVYLSPHLPLFLLFAVAIFTAGCRRDMQDQPKMKPYRATSFFEDGLSGRQPVDGTIPRGYLRTDTALYTGKKTKLGTAANAAPNPQTPAAATGQNPYPDDIEIFPLPITKDIVEWGRQRYDIFCAVCHGKTGNGDGMIARRGFRRAASFHDDRLRQAPVGHFFDAITNGWGAMPSYATQIPVQDRWAIIAYVRALQLSKTQVPATTAPGAAASPSPTPAGGHK